MQCTKVKQFTGHKAAVYSLLEAPDMPSLFSAGGEGWIVEWPLDTQDTTGKLFARIPANIFALCVLPTQNQLVAGDMHGGIYWIDCLTKSIVHKQAWHQKGTYALYADTQYLYSGGGDGVLTRWDIHTAKPVESLALSENRLRNITAWQDELCIASSDGALYWINKESFTQIHKVENAHENSVFCTHYLDENRLLSGGRDAKLMYWERSVHTHVFECRKAIPAHWATINALAVSPCGRWIATGSRDKSIRIWSAEDLSLLKVIERPKYEGALNSINTLWWSATTGWLYAGGDDRTILVWAIKE